MTVEPLHLDILLPPQRRLWEELIDVPEIFTLYGGTAIALYLGHRESVDFALFGSEKIQPQHLIQTIPFLSGSEIIQQAPNTLTCVVDRGGPVQVSFFGLPEIKPIKKPHFVVENRLKLASIIDLAGLKAAVVQQRAEAKDYLDLHAMIEQRVVDLPTALAAGQAMYPSTFNPELTLKALSYYQDGNLDTIPEQVRFRLVEAVRDVDLDRLPVLERDMDRTHGQNRGLEQ